MALADGTAKQVLFSSFSGVAKEGGQCLEENTESASMNSEISKE
jgi:hypothetical protein